MKNLTPEHLRCGPGSCPAVYELKGGKRLAIVGRLVSELERRENPIYHGVSVGEDEAIVVIDRELLSAALAAGRGKP